MLDHSGYISLNHWKITAIFTNDTNQLADEEGSLCDVSDRGDDVTGARCFTATGEGGADGAELQPCNVSCCPCNCQVLKSRHASKVVAPVCPTLS